MIALPKMTTVADGAFLADDTMVATYELAGGWMHVAPSRVGKQAFLGNSGMTAPGRSVPNRGLVGVLSATPRKAKKGSSWLGAAADAAAQGGRAGRHRAAPSTRRVGSRSPAALIELCRVVPVMCSAALAVLVAGRADGDPGRAPGSWRPRCSRGPLLLAAGVAAAGVATAMKWLLVGRFRAGRASAVELVRVAQRAGRHVRRGAGRAVAGRPRERHARAHGVAADAWARSIGRGVWLETYWLPESDLVRLGDGATVNRGCVVQTHLFHDRIMSMDEVRIDEGATLGPERDHPAGREHRRGDDRRPGLAGHARRRRPRGTRWLGNPITTWS